MSVSPSLFEEHMKTLHEDGFSTVSMTDLHNYVMGGVDLPERPIAITFDYGCMSVYTEAFPILQRYGFSATVFATGALFESGGSNSGASSMPHIGPAEALEMQQSGLISIQSQSFGMHGTAAPAQSVRDNVLRLANESEEEYILAFKSDFKRMSELIRASTGENLFAFSYPDGVIDRNSATLLREEGVLVTLSTEPGVNTLIRGLPQSLYELKRFSGDQFTN